MVVEEASKTRRDGARISLTSTSLSSPSRKGYALNARYALYAKYTLYAT